MSDDTREHDAPPSRLLDDASLDPTMRRGLEAFGRDRGFDAAAELARFEGLAAAKSVARGSLAGKWLAGAALVGIVGAALYGVTSSGSSSTSLPSPDRAITRAVPAVSTEAPRSAPADPPLIPADSGLAASDPVPAPAIGDAPVERRPVARERGDDPDLVREEMLLVAEMRRALTSEPARVLALGRDAKRRFGDGALGAEREALVVLALLGTDPTAAATRARAERFLARNATHPMAARVRAALR